MTLLSHNELCDLVEAGVITNVQPGAINASSIDIHLGPEILVEVARRWPENVAIDYRERQPLDMNRLVIDEQFILERGQFILASSVEKFYLPPNISCEYKLKSSMARIGLEHLNAGWCDAGWNNSVLTLELKNITQYHSIILRPGDAIGQMVFFRHTAVPVDKSYAARGRYNGDATTQGARSHGQA